MRNHITSIVLTEDAFSELREIAKKDSRTVSYLIRVIVNQWLAERSNKMILRNEGQHK